MSIQPKESKLHTYNQYLVASIGTLILIGIIGVIISLILSSQNDDNKTDLTTSSFTEEKNYELKISLDSPSLLDENKDLYVIPVGRIATKENTTFIRKDSYYYYNYSPLNNLILFNVNTLQSQLIFDHKLSINMYKTKKINEDLFLLILGSHQDTDANNKTNSNDLQTLFIYNTNSKSLKTYSLQNISFIDMYKPHNKTQEEIDTPIVFISGGKDINKDGIFDRKSEPSTQYKLDIQKETLVEVISEDLFQEAERIIQK